MPSKLNSQQQPDVNQLKKILNNRKMANLAAAAAAAGNQQSHSQHQQQQHQQQHQQLQMQLQLAAQHGGHPMGLTLASLAGGNGPTSSVCNSNGHASMGPNGGSNHTAVHLTHPMIRKASTGLVDHTGHGLDTSDPEIVSRIITFGSMPSYREDKLQELKRHKDSLMRSKSIESNLSPSSDGECVTRMFYIHFFPLTSSQVHPSE